MRQGISYVAVWLCLTMMLVVGHAMAQQTSDEELAPIPLRCEVYCSETKLRTINVRLTWTDPSLREGSRALVPDPSRKQEIQTSVVKGGFAKGHYASFPAIEPNSARAPETSEALRATTLPAYNLRLMGVFKPDITGVAREALVRGSPEKLETSVIIEGVEPGLKYYWRLRFETEDGWRESETVACEVPTCPADMKDGD